MSELISVVFLIYQVSDKKAAPRMWNQEGFLK
jgi:hypothetical protein